MGFPSRNQRSSRLGLLIQHSLRTVLSIAIFGPATLTLAVSQQAEPRPAVNNHGASHLGSRLILPVKVSVKQTEAAEQAACTCDRIRLQVIQPALSQDVEPQRGASY